MVDSCPEMEVIEIVDPPTSCIYPLTGVESSSSVDCDCGEELESPDPRVNCKKVFRIFDCCYNGYGSSPMPGDFPPWSNYPYGVTNCFDYCNLLDEKCQCCDGLTYS